MYTGVVCRGSWALGTACGKCQRCKDTNPAGLSCAENTDPEYEMHLGAISHLVKCRNQASAGDVHQCYQRAIDALLGIPSVREGRKAALDELIRASQEFGELE